MCRMLRRCIPMPARSLQILKSTAFLLWWLRRRIWLLVRVWIWAIMHWLHKTTAHKNNVEKEYSKIREESKFERISSKIFYCVIIASGLGMIICQLIGYEIGRIISLAIAVSSAICLGIGEKCETKEWKKEAVEKEKNIARELMNILRQH